MSTSSTQVTFLDQEGRPWCSKHRVHNQRILFEKTLYDTGSDDNIMAAVTYQLLHGTMPLQPTYIQLQTIFRSLTWEKTSMIHLPSLEDCSSNTIKAIIYIRTGEAHMHFPSKKVRHYFNDSNYIVEDSKQVKTRRRQHNRN